jgi:hypothetical protein
MNWNDYKFHPSSLGSLMTDPRSKSDTLSETCKAHLMECYIERVYGRKKEIMNKYIDKGIQCEEDSLTLYSRVMKTFYKKNKQVYENDYLIGTPDIITEDDVIEIKTSWDIFTFHQVLHKAINKDYFWQVQGYMELTEKKRARLVYCLVDATPEMVEDAKKKLAWQMKVIDDAVDQSYIDACAEIDKSMTFSDIPIEERYLQITIERDDNMIEKSHDRIDVCRAFLNKLTDKTPVLV